MRRAVVWFSIPVLVLALAGGLTPRLRGVDEDPHKPAAQVAEQRIEQLRSQLAALREQEADLVKQLQRASYDLPMVWEADGRKLEKVVHAIVLKPELPSDAPPEWRKALEATPKFVYVWKLQRVKGELVWKLERAKDAAVQITDLAKDLPPEWREVWRGEPRHVIVWTLDAEAVNK